MVHARGGRAVIGVFGPSWLVLARFGYSNELQLVLKLCSLYRGLDKLWDLEIGRPELAW